MELTAAQLAALVNGEVDGNGEVKVNTFAKIEEGHQGALSFLANPKYTHFIYTTDASVVLVKRDFVAEQPVKATLLRVDDPYATIAKLLEMVQQMSKTELTGIEQPSYIAPGVDIPQDTYVGAFAYIAKGVTLGRSVKIYPHVYIGEGVTIGDNTILNSGVKIYHGCVVGSRCIIHSGAVIGADGFGFAPVGDTYEKIPQVGNVVIEDDVEIGANTAIDRAMMGSTRISNGVKLDNLIQIAHNCIIGANTVIAAQTGIAGSTKIGQHCMFGGQVGIVGHLTIGDHTVAGAQTGISHSSKPGSRLMGTPAEDATQYARNLVRIKRLDRLNTTVEEIRSELKQVQSKLNNH